MTQFDLSAIACELNLRAKTHPIGELQAIRKLLHGLSRQPGHDIFRLDGESKTVFPNWAFHYGGRSELQFNIGIENDSGVPQFRHGIAFSFETSRSLPTIDDLAAKVPLFNDFIQLYPDLYFDMRTWHYRKVGRASTRSPNAMPGAIAPELVKAGVFVFLGKQQSEELIDYEQVLNDLDRLLPLYRYVESGGVTQPVATPTQHAFLFRAGCTVKARSTSATHAQKILDVNLRHNHFQLALYRRLSSQFGADNVGTELASGVGTSVDLVVRHQMATGSTKLRPHTRLGLAFERHCLSFSSTRFGQASQEASRLVVVGEPAIDSDGEEYLSRLRSRFSLPIHYEQISDCELPGNATASSESLNVAPQVSHLQ